ncbi:MAG: GNAT family N-acetyltransferase [Candidatus Baltobacteraceae bacterium]
MHPLSSANERAALAFLDGAPFDNVFLTWMIENDRGAAARSSLFVYAGASAEIRGVAFFGRQVVLAASEEDAARALAAAAPLNHFERMIVGPRRAVDWYWTHVRYRHRPARLVRDTQPLFAVDAASLKSFDEPRVHVRMALAGEWQTVADNSALMIEHELEYDARRANSNFDANVRVMIDRGLWWVGEREGSLCFFCSCGPRSAQTLQLQGIWVPPPLRGRGLASAALSGVCEELLADVPTLSLYVNSFNERAVALYERTGFRRAGVLKTMLF